jgi:hypothetical protein
MSGALALGDDSSFAIGFFRSLLSPGCLSRLKNHFFRSLFRGAENDRNSVGL